MSDKIDLTRLVHYEKLEMMIKQSSKSRMGKLIKRSFFHLDPQNAIDHYVGDNVDESMENLSKECFDNAYDIAKDYNKHKGYNSNNILSLDKDSESTNMQIRKDSEVEATKNVLGLYTLIDFYQSGKKIYKLSNGLANKLYYTKTNCKIDDMRCPHGCIYVQLPTDFNIPYDMKYAIDGIYIDTTFAKDRSVWVFYFIPRVKFPKGDIFNDNDKMMSLLPLFDSPMYVTAKIEKENTIDKLIKELQSQYNGGGTGRLNDIDTDGNKWYDIKELCKGITLAINTVLYITSECSNKEYVKVFKSNKDIFSNKRSTTNADYIHVGKDIEIDSQIKSIYYTKGNGIEIQARFIVSGHWHHYWMRYDEDLESFVRYNGDKSKVLIRRWIEPYWKGPEYAQVISNQYAVN